MSAALTAVAARPTPAADRPATRPAPLARVEVRTIPDLPFHDVGTGTVAIRIPLAGRRC